MSEIEVYIAAEDPRYPTLVMRCDEWTKGYSVNKNTGELTPVCLCHARYSGECACDYDWSGE